MEYALWELNPVGYHVVNVLLHGLNALVLWRLFARLRIPGSWFAAAIFALHPVQVESVAWVTEGKNTLSTLLSLATLWVWLTSVERAPQPRLGAYLCSLLLFAAALFAKTTACTLPAAQVVILWWRRELSARRFLTILPFFLLGIAMGLLTIWWEKHHQGTHGALFALRGVEAVLVAGRAVFFYLGKLVWPSPLAFSYPRFHIDGATPWQWAWPLLGVGLAAVLWSVRGRVGRAPVAALAFFVATLSPLLGFIPLYTFRYTYVADHYQYVACIGPIALFAAGAVRLSERAGSAGHRLGFVAAAALLTTLAALSFQQSRIYHDPETLWRATLERNPGSLLAHGSLATILGNRGAFQAALSHYRAAAENNPDDFLAMNNLAWALASGPEGVRNPTEAVVVAERAARATSYSSPMVLGTLALAYAGVGRLEDAVRTSEHGIQMARLVGDQRVEFNLHHDLERYRARIGEMSRGSPDVER